MPRRTMRAFENTGAQPEDGAAIPPEMPPHPHALDEARGEHQIGRTISRSRCRRRIEDSFVSTPLICIKCATGGCPGTSLPCRNSHSRRVYNNPQICPEVVNEDKTFAADNVNLLLSFRSQRSRSACGACCNMPDQPRSP